MQHQRNYAKFNSTHAQCETGTEVHIDEVSIFFFLLQHKYLQNGTVKKVEEQGFLKTMLCQRTSGRQYNLRKYDLSHEKEFGKACHNTRGNP